MKRSVGRRGGACRSLCNLPEFGQPQFKAGERGDLRDERVKLTDSLGNRRAAFLREMRRQAGEPDLGIGRALCDRRPEDRQLQAHDLVAGMQLGVGGEGLHSREKQAVQGLAGKGLEYRANVPRDPRRLEYVGL